MVAATEETALIPIETRALAQFEVSPEQVAERVKEFENLHLVPGDAKSYKQVKGAYMVIVHLRNGVDKRRKELGEEARKWTNALNAAAKKLVEPTAPLETRLKAELDVEDARIAAIAAEKERVERERVDRIVAMINALERRSFVDPGTPLSELNELFLDIFELEISEAVYMEFTGSAQRAKEKVLAGLKEGITKREAWEKGEAERKAEAERLEKIRKEQEAERKRLEDEKAKLEAEKAALEAEKKAEAEAKAKAEREAKEAKEKQEKEAREKEDHERKLKEAAEHSERIQPDKKKIISWVHGIFDHPRPDIQEKEAQAIFIHAVNDLRAWAEMIIREAEKL